MNKKFDIIELYKNVKKDVRRNRSYSFKIYEVIILVVATCLLSFYAGSTIMELNMERRIENGSLSVSSKNDKYLNRFIENYEYIIDNYYHDVDKEELINGAIAGMMDKIDDPYTMYMDEEKYDKFNIVLNGSYSGLGVEITKNNDGYLIILSVISNSPASEAGLIPGDIIKSINGDSTADYSSSEFSNKVLNSKETNFKVLVERNGEDIEFMIKKSRIILSSVISNVFEREDKKIGYIYISIFAFNTYKQFENKLKELEDKGIDALIIDVRSNTGGHLTSAEKIVSLFVDSKHVIYQMKKGDEITKYKSKGSKNKKYPIVLLGNIYSASASELLISALKENLNAKLIGTKTFGKGTVQELVNLSNGDQYKITTKEWLTGKGNQINGIGIEPDMVVELGDDYINNPSNETDSQLQAAINYLVKETS